MNTDLIIFGFTRPGMEPESTVERRLMIGYNAAVIRFRMLLIVRSGSVFAECSYVICWKEHRCIQCFENTVVGGDVSVVT